MKNDRQNLMQRVLVLLLIMLAIPALASAANTATLELANNRSEAVYVTVQSWYKISPHTLDLNIS